ncbi:PROBABLE CONSERVED INTEGRAL MEMBRANE ALANINE AND LEUCINE RICH PROTEIN [Microbacterium esteraromaticum]|uniref:PROBABLE CONSERVED INTEGRAL MEMBRANE ALANINE AND LEUCINE RICH PROTEIN n=1 Tax=Microbacterium esteraromaticum TaxID=57043 RepID=A0A1R4IUH7_9MICO|nr:DUF3159 domain-containing protein [Microbacterium esteraromaticum]SJN23319.1 PROBABLE CONSERVED INTEGRAL MEMBRANE ALANINE AND LEUCINE RICH PROTEIN [Microbacterium esteraromaticum]
MTEHSSAASEDGAEEDPSAAEIFGTALGSAARRAGIDPEAEQTTGQMVWQVIGGWRGIMESVLPLLTFIVTYTVTRNLLLGLGLSVGIAAVFSVVRLVMKSPPVAALSGLIAAVIAAGLPLFTGRAEDQFVIGFITNIAYGAAFLVSALVRWPLIGVVVGFLTGEGLSWRKDATKRRVFAWLSVAWALLFLLRLGIQLPFYFQGDVATLGTVKIVMGIPFFAALLAITWLVTRRLYPRES